MASTDVGRRFRAALVITLASALGALGACGGETGSGEEDDIADLSDGQDTAPDVETEGGCEVDSDCASGACDQARGECLEATCADGVANGGESGVDCGGSSPCRRCNPDEGCQTETDCLSQICDASTGLCAPKPESCDDNARNNLESDVDCGGPRCNACDGGRACDQDEDCLSDFCNVANFECLAPAFCDDNLVNGTETDVDCGGICGPCEEGGQCLTSEDCASERCAGVCLPPATCDDGEQNGAETDVDCGGPTCDPCGAAAACEVATDCLTGRCDEALGQCSCLSGFAVGVDGGCVDVDECATGADDCDVNATCTNTSGGFTCACNEPIYTGDGQTCELSTDCSDEPTLCDANAACVTQGDGSSICVCASGYTGGGTSCADIDECMRGTADCDPLAGCVNTPGDFTCGDCPAGYTDTFDDGTACEEIDECADPDLNDCDDEATCTDGVNAYTCACPPELEDTSGDGTSCRPYATCAALHAAQGGLGSGVYAIDPDGSGGDAPFEVYCDMTTAGGGWTLALRIDGRDDTFGYSEDIWENSTLRNADEPGLARTEAKLETFNSIDVSEVMVALEAPIPTTAGAAITYNHVVITLSSSDRTLHEIFDGSRDQRTSLGRATWKAVMNGSSLQNNCNREGFNIRPGDDSEHARARIGIVANQENNCDSPDSVIGVGTRGWACGMANHSAGNMAGCGGDNGETNTPAFGFVFVR